MDLTPATVGAGCAVLSLVGGGAVAWVRESIASVKNTQKTLFDKLDKQATELSDYKLHVAETYIAEEKLEKMLTHVIGPVNARLDRIEGDLRRDRVGP